MMDGATAETARPGSLDDLARRLGRGGDSRPAQGLLAAVEKAVALVGDLRLTPDELRTVIEFLTEVGQASDARRQEWVLLADVLGISALVEDGHRPCAAGATPAALPGPFYRGDVPDMADGANLSRDGRGEPLHVTLAVRDGAGGPVAGAAVEVWHANAEGLYENQEPDRQPEFNLRGRFRADAGGGVRFQTIRPRGLTLPEDGPVGRLMNRLGLRLVRPAHLHFRITAAGFVPLTTHVFDRDDPAIGHDALFGVKPALLASFRPEDGCLHLDYTFVLTPLAAP
ncbi:MAG: dioxygenase family protein [Gemmobacter sp.]